MFSRIESKKNVTKATILFHESNTEIELRFCHYQVSYTIQKIKKPNVYDDGLYLHQESKILSNSYLLSVDTCQSVWTGEVFKLPGCGNQEFKLNKVISDRTETTETFDYSAMFMKSGIGYAHAVEWTIPLGETIVGSVKINARQAIGKVYASKRMPMDEFLFTCRPLRQ